MLTTNAVDNTPGREKLQSRPSIPFPKTESADLLEDDLHRAAMFASQSRLHLCRAVRTARNTKARRVLNLLIDGQQQAIDSLQRLRTGGAGAL